MTTQQLERILPCFLSLFLFFTIQPNLNAQGFYDGVPQESWALKQECMILLRSMPVAKRKARPKPKRKRRTHSEEFKREAVKLI